MRNNTWTAPSYNGQPTPTGGSTLDAFIGIDNVVVSTASRPTADNVLVCENNSATVQLTSFDASASLDYLWYTAGATNPVATTAAGSYSGTNPPTYTATGLGYGNNVIYVAARVPGTSIQSSRVPVTITRSQRNNTLTVNRYDYEGRSSSSLTATELSGTCPSCYGGVAPGGPATFLSPAPANLTNYCIVSRSGAPGLVALAAWAGSSSGSNNGPSLSECIRSVSMSGDAFFVARAQVDVNPVTNLPATVVVWQSKVYLRAGEQYGVDLDVRDLAFGTPAGNTTGSFGGRASGFVAQLFVDSGVGSPAQLGASANTPSGHLGGAYTPGASGYFTISVRIMRNNTWTAPSYNGQPTPTGGSTLDAFIGIDNVVVSYSRCGYAAPVVPSAATCDNVPLTLTATCDYPTPGSTLPPGLAFKWYLADGVTEIPPSTTSSTRSTLVVSPPPGGVPLPYSATYKVSIAGAGFESQPTTATALFNAPVARPSVVAGTLCPGTRAPVVMAVSPAVSGLTYQWYDTDGTTPIASTNGGQSCTVTVSGAATYFVQALPQGGAGAGCPSPLTPVDIRLQTATLPTVVIPTSMVRGNVLSATLTGDPTYTYIWNWHDPASPALSTGTSVSHTYQTIGTYDVELSFVDTHAPPCTTVRHFTVTVANKLCEVVLDGSSLSGLRVQLSNRTGAYVVETPAAACLTTSTLFDCLTGQGEGQEVVAASAVAYSATAPAPDDAYGLTAASLAANPFLAGGGRLRPEATYAYSTPVLATAGYERSTERGRFLAVPFNWQLSAANRLPAWQRAGLATRYSPDGPALEEQDVLQIYSTVKLGYRGHSLPYLSAKNASYGQVLFESFEKDADNPLEGEDQFTVSSSEATRTTEYAHAGTRALELSNDGGQAQLTLRTFQTKWTGQTQVKYWLRISESSTPAQALGQQNILAQATLSVHWAGTNLPDSPVAVVAQTGEWLLCEATAAGLPATSVAPQLLAGGLGTRRIWLDDVRVQPLAAQVACSVYDPASLRLLASFDDQHFGLYYQYNTEGKLVRKLVETERGLKTIQETQYHAIQP
jgi:hypothetical protein